MKYCFSITILIPLFSIIILTFLPNKNLKLIRGLSLLFSFSLCLFTFILLLFYQSNINPFQFIFTYEIFSFLNFTYKIGLDGLSIAFLMLTSYLLCICILVSWNVTYNYKTFIITIFFITFILFQLFISLDLIFFYIFFEAVLIPMFILIGVWGSRSRKIHAAYQFFLYTLIGSLFMLVALLVILSSTGTSDLTILYSSYFSESRQFFLWVAFFLAFAVKIPLVPFHIWLPEAHVEAPTVGSIILAGILLKLGSYGFLRILLPLFPLATVYFLPFVYTICIISIIYSSLTTLRQIDLKKIIAYSSIGHMAYVVLGIFSLSIYGIIGSVFLMFAHAFVSSALFITVGILYERYHTRILLYYQGLFSYMPIFSILFLFFTFANISFPGTGNFIGEFLVLIGLAKSDISIACIAVFITILSVTYAIWLANRLLFRITYPSFIYIWSDLNCREFFSLIPFIILTIWFGFFPNNFIKLIFNSSLFIVQFFFEYNSFVF